MSVSIRKTSKILGTFSLVMINIIAVDSLRSLPFSAEYGFSLVFYYLLGALVFFIPIGLVSAELATAFPDKGGIYVWVREAFGEFWGFLIIWLQWVYNVVWYPTILSFVAATLGYMLDPQLAENKLYMLTMVNGIFWGATLLNCFGMRMSSWISTIGALFGTLFPMFLIIVLAGVWLWTGRHSQITFTNLDLLPNLKDAKMLAFLTALLFGLVGLEMSAVHADEVKEPGKSYPRAILLSTIIILTSLILSSLAIAIVVPHSDLSVVTGLVQAFNIFFTAFHMKWFSPIITILIILGGISGVATWIIGPTKGLFVAAMDGNAPAFLAKTNSKGVPTNILLLQGVIFSVLCSVFILMPTVSSSYWVLTVMTAQLAMLVYIAMFAAGIWLRYKRPDAKRQYRIPFGNFGIWLAGLLGSMTCVLAIVLGFFPPAQIDVGRIAVYESILVIGIIVLSVPPMLMYRFRHHN